MIAETLNTLSRGWPARALLAALLVTAIGLPWVVAEQSYLLYLVFTFFVFATFGHAWNLLAGYCGLLSFGNQVYVGVGGFALAILYFYGGVDVWVALILGGAVAGVFAFLLAVPVRESLIGLRVWRPVTIAIAGWIIYEIVIVYWPDADVIGETYVRRVIILLLIFLGALPLLRLQGAYFAVATWLIAAAVGSIFNEWKLVGAGGGMQIKTEVTQIEMYYAGLILLVAATWVVRRILSGRYGLALTAVRDDEEAATTVGIDIRKVKLLVFVIAGTMTGLAAGLYYIDAVIITPPAAFTIFWSAYFVFIVVAGGMGTLAGPIIGAAIFVIIDRVLSGVTEYPLLVLGIAAIVLIFVLPRGVMGIVGALCHLDDSTRGRTELVEALGLSGLYRLLRIGAGQRQPAVVAAFLLPGHPLPVLKPDNPPWAELVAGMRAAGQALRATKPDLIVIYSTQWIAVLDQLWQTRPRLRGTHVDENWYEYGDLEYDIDIDVDFAEACVSASKLAGVRAKGVGYDGFPIDTGTIVACSSLNPDGKLPLAIAANNLYHDWDTTYRLGEMAANQAIAHGRRVAVVGVGGLSGSTFRREIDIADDHIAEVEDDRWNRRMLALLERGEVTELKAQLGRYTEAAKVDMGFKHLAFVLGAIGDNYHGAKVHAYGPLYGSGGAVVAFHLDEASANGARKSAATWARRGNGRDWSVRASEQTAEQVSQSTGGGHAGLAPSPQPSAPAAATEVAAPATPSRLYRGFATQAEIDRQYDVEGSVPDFGIYVKYFLENSERIRDQLDPTLDVPYGPTASEHVDIYRADRADASIHMFIHGGYWHSLSSKEFSLVAEGLVKAGVTVAIVNYALCPKVTITEIARQNRAAVAWLYRNAAGFGGNRERIYVSGHSSGGHLTAMLMATDWRGEYGLPADVVKGGCAISGLFDLAPFPHSWLQPKLGLTAEEVDRMSPINHIPERAGPLLVTVGGDESEEFHRQSQEFLAAWNANGLDGRFVELPGRNHFTVLEEYADPNSALLTAILRQMGERGR